MKSLFETNTYTDILSRIKKLNENSQPVWGKMTVGQMAYHCQVALNIVLEKKDYNLKPSWIVNLLFKKSMYNDNVWRKNMPTAKAFKVVDEKQFSEEIKVLTGLINELYQQKDKTNWQDHPSFGKLTKNQWGQMQYKHLNHHLTQFGV